jgi:hypothetical protein
VVRTVLFGMVDNTCLVHLNLRRHPTVRTEPYAVTAAVQGRPAARRRRQSAVLARRLVLARRRAAVLARRLVLARRAVRAGGGQDAVIVEPKVVFAAVEGAFRQAGRRSNPAPPTAAAGCLTTRPRYDSPSYLDPSRKRK